MIAQTFKSLIKASAGIVLALGLASCGDTNGKTYPDAEATKIAVPEGKSGYYGDILYGDPNAKIEIIEYASLTCPACRFFDTRVLPTIKKKYVATGIAKVIFRNFTMNTTDLKASLLVRCKDGAFAAKAKTALYERFDIWVRAENSDDSIAQEARRLGMPRTAFDRCMQDVDMQRHLTALKKIGLEQYDVSGTPFIYVNGKLMDGFQLETVEAAIKAAQ